MGVGFWLQLPKNPRATTLRKKILTKNFIARKVTRQLYFPEEKFAKLPSISVSASRDGSETQRKLAQVKNYHLFGLKPISTENNKWGLI